MVWPAGKVLIIYQPAIFEKTGAHMYSDRILAYCSIGVTAERCAQFYIIWQAATIDLLEGIRAVHYAVVDLSKLQVDI